MDIARCHMRIHDDAVFAIHRAVIQEEEASRFVIPLHKTAFRVGGADFCVLNDGTCSFGGSTTQSLGHNVVKNVLEDIAVVEAANAVLAEG